MSSIHGHDVLSMMEGNAYSDESLLDAIANQFGSNAVFHTCSQSNMTAKQLITFLKSKNKFISLQEGGYTVNKLKICHHK